MTDAEFSWVTVALWAVAIGAYAIRVARFGSFNSERVAGVGGTMMVGEDIMQATYWAIDPVVRGLVKLGATPNGVTWASFIFGAGAGAAVGAGWFGLACLLATCSTMCDILDGQVARLTGKGSASGELLDAIIDRYTEFGFIAGFIFYVGGHSIQIGIAMAALLACFMISYTSAKAEALQVAPPRGLMRRHERAVYLITGAGVTPLMGPTIHAHWDFLPATLPFLVGLGVVAFLGNFSAVQRMTRIARALHASN